MNKFSHVNRIFHLIETGDQTTLIKLLETGFSTEIEDIVDDLSYVLISLWGMLNSYQQAQFKERLLSEITAYDVNQMEFDLPDE